MYNYITSLLIFYQLWLYSRDTIKAKWAKWNELNTLMSRRTQNRILIIWYSMVMLFNIVWISMLQYINNTVVCVGKNKYEVSYVISGKLYKFQTKVHRGPIPILQIIDDNDHDVTSLILPYMGPQFKGHDTIPPTPTLLGYESLTFETSNGTSYTCTENDIIMK